MNHHVFKKNYLKEIIFRVDFHPILELSGEFANPKIFENIIGDEFREIDNLNNPQYTEDNQSFKIWIYQNEDFKKIELTNTYIALSYNGEYYTDYQNLLNDVNLIKEALIKYNVEKTNYIGLRYINEITPNEKIEWDDWINPNLNNFRFNVNDSQFIRSLNKAEYKIDDLFLSFKYGQFNLNYPSPVIRDDFILDYDCYTKNLEEIVELDNIFIKMNNIIYNFFIRSIGEKLKVDLEG